ncbi:MAG: hypothetical protein HY897_04315 [Deltaproteobacteria bacterium]|nr:hypothetical protein [Deltaproteobacteria bacterium]
MKFAVSDLKSLSKAVRSLSTREGTALSAMLQRQQRDFFEIIDEVGMDPRCARAHRFCTMFCALAFGYAEGSAGYRLPRYPGDAIQETAGFMARGEEAQIGRRACGYRKRILRHVLTHDDFDEDDTAWLCTTISAFLFLVERSLGRRR